MKKISLLLLINIIFFMGFAPVISNLEDYSENDTPTHQEEVFENIVIFDEENNYITERSSVNIGDKIIDKNFREYEVISVDTLTQTAVAKFVRNIEKPTINSNKVNPITQVKPDEKIGLYSTHNDESYIIGDNTESIYGAGGIHDIGILLQSELAAKNITTIYDQTLHIPHNSSAYSRSRVTAKNLLNQGATAIFDIHRDGASRSFYLTEYKGENYSKVRIVVGQSNPNKEANLQLALWMVSVAQELYPWMIADIYYGSGKYNQDLNSKALLFEMGCHKIEKTYVENTVPFLADVIYTTLFGTTVNEEENDLTIGEPTTENDLTINEILEEKNTNSNILEIIFITIFSGIILGIIIKIIKNRVKN